MQHRQFKSDTSMGVSSTIHVMISHELFVYKGKILCSSVSNTSDCVSHYTSLADLFNRTLFTNVYSEKYIDCFDASYLIVFPDRPSWYVLSLVHTQINPASNGKWSSAPRFNTGATARIKYNKYRAAPIDLIGDLDANWQYTSMTFRKRMVRMWCCLCGR